MPRWSRPPTPQTNWFAIATAIAAITVAFCGGLSVGGQAEPLTLTLSAPEICDTQPVVEAFAGEYDEDGKQVVRSFGWFNPGDVQVTWVAEGGTPPYRLTIDGQNRDIRTWEPFGAQSGAGTVSCARTRGQAFIVGDVAMSADGPAAHTYFHEQPNADSGRKTIRATVTDNSGATTDATVDVYVILSVPGRGTPMEAGKTYRIQGTLLTVPDGIRLEMRGAFSGIGGASGFALHVLDLPDGNDAWLNVTLSLAELSRHVPPHSEDDSPKHDVDLHAKFDELIASVGQLPKLPSGAEPLTLTLSAPEICETTPAQGYADSVLRQDAEGNWTKRVSVFAGWFGVAEVDVAWTVSGGAAPYRLRIDGERRDPAHEYVGATGIASVSCAMTSGAAAFIDISERGYKAQPEVDSGVKMIPATVTDATGATAEASVDIHVILELGSTGDILQGGKTYRVFRKWLTVPEGIDLEIGDYEAGDGGTTSYGLHVVGRSAEIWLDPYLHQQVFRFVPPGEEEIHAKFDELVASVGRAPSIADRSK